MPNKAIFLDRDDTLIEDAGYISNPDQVKLLDGVPESLIELKDMGYKLIVVSNQSAVARGIVSEKVLGEIHNRLKQLLAEKGATLDKIYYCPYHPEGIIAKYRKESDWRKPSPGMLLAAADEMDIDFGQSWVIGNSGRDIEAGLRVGCKTILIDNPSRTKMPEAGKPNPDFMAVDITEAANIIKRNQRSSATSPVRARQQSQAAEKQNRQGRPETETDSAGPEVCSGRGEELLDSILRELKGIRRADRFSDFSAMRRIAGLAQIITLFCLLISIWLLMSPTRQDGSVLIALGFAAVFQVMALSFYAAQGRK